MADEEEIEEVEEVVGDDLEVDDLTEIVDPDFDPDADAIDGEDFDPDALVSGDLVVDLTGDGATILSDEGSTLAPVDPAKPKSADDDDDEDDTIEYESWRIRELTRVERDSMLKITHEKEKAETERRRGVC